MTVVLALAAAAFYGLGDFVGGVASRRSSVWPVGLLSCVGALAGALVLALVTAGDPTAGQVGWALLAGVGGGVGTTFLYRGLAGGRMGVVAPVSGVGSVLVPLAVGVLGGDRPEALAWLGIALAVPGIWFVAREPASGATGSSGLLDGVLAGLGFGVLFAALGQVPESAGYWPLVGTQAVSVGTLAVAALLLGGDPVPRQRADLAGLVAGVLSVVAVLCFLLATRHGLLSVAAVITSLYPAFTVLLAIGVLRERVHAAQAVGLGLCAASVVCVSLA